MHKIQVTTCLGVGVFLVILFFSVFFVYTAIGTQSYSNFHQDFANEAKETSCNTSLTLVTLIVYLSIPMIAHPQ